MCKVAILGFGTVGSGVAEVLTGNAALIADRSHVDIELKYILDVRDFPESPFRDKIIHDFSLIERDSEISIVVETIGGVGVAKEFTQRALCAGKSVVTSNKELVAKHGSALMKLAEEHGASYLFEASVGGGIPIIRPLQRCLAANRIEEICGILNGTTNYILTRMIRAGLPFEAALKEAQEKGYAEQDPTADIEGHDACRKICILASLAFGRAISPDVVPCKGIDKVTLVDVAYAEGCGKKIKLLGRTLRREDGRIAAYVAPHLVDVSSPLSGVEDVFNAIMVRGDAVGDVMFYGRGAGKLPTASAVVADVIDVAEHMGAHRYPCWSGEGGEALLPAEELESAWYVRVPMGADAVRQAFPAAELLARPGALEGESAFLTLPMSQKVLMARCEALKPVSMIRVLG